MLPSALPASSGVTVSLIFSDMRGPWIKHLIVPLFQPSICTSAYISMPAARRDPSVSSATRQTIDEEFDLIARRRGSRLLFPAICCGYTRSPRLALEVHG